MIIQVYRLRLLKNKKIGIMNTNIFYRLLLVFFYAFSFGQAGMLDTTFNGVGFRLIDTTDNQTGVSFNNSTSVLQNDGKIVMAGPGWCSNSGRCATIMRLNSDGTTDTAFGVDGFFRLTPGTLDSFCGLTIQLDGKIVFAGTYRTPSSSDDKIIVIRLNNNGTIDNNFGTTGFRIIDINTYSTATCVKIQSDNKILVGGSNTIINPNFGLTRLMPNGDLDTSFATNGMTQTINGTIGLNSEIYAMDIQPDGKILCSGKFYEINNTFDNFCTVRYNNNGTIDSTFGTNGMVLTAVDIGGDVIYSQLIQPDGKILLAGYSSDGAHFYMPIMRLNSDGSLDTSFGNDGLVSQDISGISYPICKKIILQPDGKIVAVGYGYQSFIARFNSNGSLDTTFNNTGFNVCDFNPSPLINGVFNSVFLLPNGKLLATGLTDYNTTIFSSYYTTIARFESGLNLSNESFNKNNVAVYPNPTNNKSFFDNSQSQFNNLEIYNYLGQLVSSQKMQFSNNQEIDLSKFSTGIYVLKMSNENESVSIKIVKE